MQQVLTEKHCAQGGKACARKAGSRLAALALALAMVFTTALPAFAEETLDGLDNLPTQNEADLGGTSTGETEGPGTGTGNEEPGTTAADTAPGEPSAPQPEGTEETDPNAGPNADPGADPNAGAGDGNEEPGTSAGNTPAPQPGETGETGSGLYTINNMPGSGLMPLASGAPMITFTCKPTKDVSFTELKAGTELEYTVTIKNDGGDLRSKNANADTYAGVKFNTKTTKPKVNQESVEYTSSLPQDVKLDVNSEHVRLAIDAETKASANHVLMPGGMTISFTAKVEITEDMIDAGEFSFEAEFQTKNLSDNNKPATQTITFAAPKKTFTLNYYGSDGSGAPVVDRKDVPEGRPAIFTLWNERAARRNGITPPVDMMLAGWATTPNAVTPDYQPDTDLTVTGETTNLYAVWAAKTITVIYDANGGYFGRGNEDKKQIKTEPQTPDATGSATFVLPDVGNLKAPEFKTSSNYNGRIFVGWYPEKVILSADGKMETESVSGGDPTGHSSYDPNNLDEDLRDEWTAPKAGGTSVTFTQNTPLYAVWGPALGYTMTVTNGDFPQGKLTSLKDNSDTSADWILDDPAGAIKLQENGLTESSSAKKYVVYDTYYQKGNKIRLSTVEPEDFITSTADKDHFVAWYDKRAQDDSTDNDETDTDYKTARLKDKIARPGEKITFRNTFFVHSFDALWFDMTTRDRVYVYDGEEKSLPELTPKLSVTDDFKSNNPTDEIFIVFDSFTYSGTYQAPGGAVQPLDDLAGKIKTIPDGDKKKIQLPGYTDAGVYTFTVTAAVKVRVDDVTNSIDNGKVDSNGFVTLSFENTATLTILPRPVRITGEAKRPWTGQPQTVYFTIGSPSGVPAGADKETPDYLLDETAFNAFKATPTAGSYYDALTPELKTAAGKLTREQRDALTLTGDPVVSRDASFTYLHSLTETEGTMPGTGGTCTLNKANYIVTDEVRLTIVKSTATANLTVEKNFAVGSGSASGTTLPAQTFTFTLVGPGSADGVTVSSNTLDIEVSQSQPTNRGTFTLTFDRPGKYKYTVTETNDGAPGVGYDTDSPRSVEFEVSYDPASKTLTVTPPSQTVSFTNTYTKAKTGSLTIEKRLEGIAETLDAGKTFSFTVTALDNTALAGSFTTNVSGTTVNFANGTANITVKHGTPVTINNLPIGKYTVKEVTGTGYTLTDYDVSGEGTFEVTDGGNVTAPVTNARKTGSLTIEKRLEGIAGTLDAGKTFTFTVTAPVDLALAGQSFTATGGDVTFTAGTGRSAAATVQVPAGKSVTIEGLPIGTYTVTETESMDHTYTFGNYTVAYSGGAAFASAAVPFKGNAGVTVTNTRKTGNLTIEKKLEGIAEAVDAGKTFSFTVTALDETTLAGTFTTNVSGTTVNFANGTANITVKHGTPVTINNLPIGKYEVKETGDLGNYTVSGGGEVTVTAGGTVTAPVANARKTGSLTIHKDLNGTKTSLDPDTFTMTVTAPEGLALAGQSFTATDGDVTFTAGAGGGATATVEVPVNGSVTIEGLPLGTYTVTEKNSNDYTFTVTGGNAEVTDGGNANVTVANIRKTGKLTVHKTVDGTPAAGDAKVFDFTVTLTPAVDATYSGVEFNGGVGHFTLEDGQDRIIELPAGMGYVVDETPVPAHYTKSSTTPSGKITAGKTDTVTFTNKYQSALGTLRLYKTVTDAPASEKDRLFTFTVKADDTSLEGTFNGVKFAGGTATVTLAAGGEITIPRLPAGTYTVEETAVDIDGDPETHDDVTDLAGYTVSHTVKAAGGAETGASAAKTTPFEIVRDGVTDVTFINARKPYDLTLHKTVSRDPQDTGTEPIPMDNAFGFKVTFKDASGKELPATDTFDYTLEYTDGSTTRTFYGTVASGGQVFLTNRDILIIKGLPAGTQYTVEEVTYNSTLYTPGAPPANASGTLNGPVDVTFTNTYKSSSIPGKDTLYADLSLTKDIRTAANHTLDKEGQHTIGMLYSWTEPYTGNFTPVQIPVKLTLEAGNAEHELSNNGGLGYVFAFDVEANNSAVDVGSGIALIAVPADILTNESSVTYGDGTDATVYIEVYVDTQYTSSAGTTPYTVTVTEKTPGGDASFTPDRTPQEVEITVDNFGKVTAQRKTDNSEFIEFKNTYTGKVSNGDPVDIPLPRSEGTNRAYAYFDTVPLGGQFDYSRKFTLPVSNTGNTVVHLFELDNSSYTFKGTDPYTGIGKFYPSSEGGVLTFSKADLQGYDKNNHANLGNMTFINIPDPAPVSLALQVDTWLDADDGKTPLPAGSYDFAYDVDANGDGKFEDTSPETITVADGNTEPSADVLHDPPHLFTFDREGTYTYYLQGQDCGNGRINYDTDKHAVRITIGVDNELGSPTDGDLKVDSVKWDTWDTAAEDMKPASMSEEKYNDADGDGQPDDKDQPVANIYLLPVRNTYTAPVFDVTMPFTKVFELAEGSEDPKDTTAAYTFNFSLTPVDGAPAPAGAEVPVRVSVPTAAAKQEATGTFTIRGLPMDPGAKYAYTLREQVPAAAADKPIGYDSESSYTVSFTVKGDAKAVTVVIEDAAGSLLHQHELPMEGAADLVIDMKDVVKTLSFTNTYTPPEPNTSDPGKPGGKPSDPDPHPEEPQPAAEEEDDTPAPTPAPVAVSVPRTADDMPLGAVWALFAASAAALAGLAAIRLRRRRKSK